MKNSFSAHSYFIETFKLNRTNPRKFNYRLKNHDFSRNENLLLRAYKAYTSSDKKTIFELLKNKNFQEPFLEATRLYLLGITLNHFGTFKFAIEKLEESVLIYKRAGSKDFLIYPYLALLICYSNQKNIKMVKKYLKLILPIRVQDSYLEITKDHSLCLGNFIIGEIDTSLKILTKVYQEENDYLDIYISGFLLIEFSIKLQKNDPDVCFEILERYKNLKTFAVKENYAFMKSLMDHIYKDAPLYVYRHDFKDIPELCDQLEFIKAISRADISKAEKIWQELRRHNPHLYQDKYFYNGEFCLFSLAIDKHRKNLEVGPKIIRFIDEKMSPIEKLEILFSESEISILKENLIASIWGEEISEVTMARLRKLISRYNKNNSKKIVSYQESYKKIS